MTTVRAPYMEWAKSRRPAAYDLAGSNLLACSIEDLPGAREALDLIGSNENGYPPLLEAIAHRYSVTPERVATAPGASGANFLAFAALVEPGIDVLVERPGYDPLVAVPRLFGARVLRFDRRFEDGYALDPARVEAALTPQTRLIVITNPHNPSGVIASDEALDAVGRLAAMRGARVLVDEVYLDAAAGRRTPAATRSEVFVSTSSLTKSYGLNALRCGWAIASAEVAERIRRARDLVDGIGAVPIERLAVMAFVRLDQLAARARAIIGPNAELVDRFVERRPELEWVRPAGGTVAFPRLHAVEDAETFVNRLLEEHDTAVVPGRFFDTPGHFRIAFGGLRDTVAGGLERIGRLLDRIKDEKH